MPMGTTAEGLVLALSAATQRDSPVGGERLVACVRLEIATAGDEVWPVLGRFDCRCLAHVGESSPNPIFPEMHNISGL